MKRAFMIILFLFVAVLLVAFLLKYNQYRNGLNEDLSGENQVQNENISEDFSSEIIEDEEINHKLNTDNLDEYETNVLEDNLYSGEAKTTSGEVIDGYISGEMTIISGEVFADSESD